jgi:hypothetical protein
MISFIFRLIPILKTIVNVQVYRNIDPQGGNDAQILVEQSFLLQQRLTKVNHPDHIVANSFWFGSCLLSGISMVYQFRTNSTACSNKSIYAWL